MGYAKTSVNTSIFRKSSLITFKNYQFVSFYNKKGRVILGQREINSDKWKLCKQTLKGNIKDAHNIISLGIDGEGYLHMAFGLHGKKMQYTRSVKALSLKMMPLQGIDGNEENKVTYPEFYSLPDGDLLLAYRSGTSGNGNMVMKRYSLESKNWTTIQSNLIDGGGERNAYWQMCVDKNGYIHVSWVWRETNDVATNHDLCYACSKDGGTTWENSSGVPYSLPIDINNAEIICRIPQNSELMNQTSMTVDNEGYPYIATFWRDKDSEVPQYRVVWKNDKGWKTTQMGERKTPFTLSGKGTKMVPISRPVILLYARKVVVIFRDKERESRVSMAIASDIEAGDWKFYDLTQFSVDAWEPTYDMNLWNDKKILNLFVQETHQGDGEKVHESSGRSSLIWVKDATSYLKETYGR